MSAAKLALIGVLGAAVITAVVPAGFDWLKPDSVPTPTLPITQIDGSRFGAIDSFSVEGPEVSVGGWALNNVESVVVGIGPRPDGKQYWTAVANVENEKWSVVVPVSSGLPADYKTKVWYQTRTGGVHSASFRMEPAYPTPPPMPNDIATCAALYGDACFTGPGWQPPSVYQGG
jgi:hypothetical protein